MDTVLHHTSPVPAGTEQLHVQAAQKGKPGYQWTSDPTVCISKMVLMFTEPGSSALSTEKHELLINYILVLTPYADEFRSHPKDICEDLKMTRQMIKPYYDQLGCKSSPAGAFKSSVMTLPAPSSSQKKLQGESIEVLIISEGSLALSECGCDRKDCSKLGLSLCMLSPAFRITETCGIWLLPCFCFPLSPGVAVTKAEYCLCIDDIF